MEIVNGKLSLKYLEYLELKPFSLRGKEAIIFYYGLRKYLIKQYLFPLILSDIGYDKIYNQKGEIIEAFIDPRNINNLLIAFNNKKRLCENNINALLALQPNVTKTDFPLASTYLEDTFIGPLLLRHENYFNLNTLMGKKNQELRREILMLLLESLKELMTNGVYLDDLDDNNVLVNYPEKKVKLIDLESSSLITGIGNDPNYINQTLLKYLDILFQIFYPQELLKNVSNELETESYNLPANLSSEAINNILGNRVNYETAEEMLSCMIKRPKLVRK